MPRARAHALRDTRRDDAVIALAVAVFERTVEHPRDDLHVAVAVRPESAAGGDHVVVQHEQESVMDVLRVVVVREAEAVPRIEPVDLGVEPLVGAPDVDHVRLQKRTP